MDRLGIFSAMRALQDHQALIARRERDQAERKYLVSLKMSARELHAYETRMLSIHRRYDAWLLRRA